MDFLDWIFLYQSWKVKWKIRKILIRKLKFSFSFFILVNFLFYFFNFFIFLLPFLFLLCPFSFEVLLVSFPSFFWTFCGFFLKNNSELFVDFGFPFCRNSQKIPKQLFQIFSRFFKQFFKILQDFLKILQDFLKKVKDSQIRKSRHFKRDRSHLINPQKI